MPKLGREQTRNRGSLSSTHRHWVASNNDLGLNAEVLMGGIEALSRRSLRLARRVRDSRAVFFFSAYIGTHLVQRPSDI
jgi:hypothetical protein